LTAAEIKSILQETAREDSITGDLSETGDVRWGWGKVNALHAIYKVLGVEGLNEINKEEKVLIYPNPASDQVCILAVDGNVEREISIFSVDGRLIKTEKLNEQNVFHISGLNPGMYLTCFVLNGKQLMMPIMVKSL